MALKRYDAVVNGVKTILVLNAADAERLGDAVRAHEKSREAASSKSRPASGKARGAANKSRTASNKKPANAPTEKPSSDDGQTSDAGQSTATE